MFHEEEKQLQAYRDVYQDIPAPLDALDDAIMVGFQKARQEEKRNMQRRRIWFSLATAVLLLIGFFSTVRLSPAFANYVSTTIPGMERIVAMIQSDKGMLAAVANEYYQELNISAEKDGIKVTIDGALADENGVVLFYTLDSGRVPANAVDLEDVELKGPNGEKLDISSVSFGKDNSLGESNQSAYGKIDVYFQTAIAFQEFQLELSVDKTKFKLPITLDATMMKKQKVYPLNQTVVMEGQSITIEKVVVYPTRVAVHVKADPANSMTLLEFQDLRLVDEHGESWRKISNGITANTYSVDEKVYYLQSNYFQDPSELTLVFNRIQAVAKEENQVVVDLEQTKILQQPAVNVLSDFRVQGHELLFTLNTKDEFHYFPFGTVTGSTGAEVLSSSSTSSFAEDGKQEIGVTIDKLSDVNGRLALKIEFFPSWIEGEARIKIK